MSTIVAVRLLQIFRRGIKDPNACTYLLKRHDYSLGCSIGIHGVLLCLRRLFHCFHIFDLNVVK